jgi:serine/threonine protein phosphatase 1
LTVAATNPPTPRPAPLTDARSRERFGRLRTARRVWAIAAIHGEADKLAGLHARIGPAWEEGDRLVYLGNLMGRGPEVRRTIDEILAFRLAVLATRRGFACDVALLRGGQEEMWQKLLQLQFAVSPREILQWMLDQGDGATIAAYGGDPRQGFQACREGPRALTRWTSSLRASVNAAGGHAALLSALRRAAYTDDGGLLFVHAGLDPARPLDAQGDEFWWGGARFLELTEPYAGFRRVIRGFDRKHAGIVEAPHAVSVDGGCGFGGDLIAACFAADGTLLGSLAA